MTQQVERDGLLGANTLPASINGQVEYNRSSLRKYTQTEPDSASKEDLFMTPNTYQNCGAS